MCFYRNGRTIKSDLEAISAIFRRCFMRFDDRAERLPMAQIMDSFVSVGPMIDILENRSNQIIYGRRGAGKTHALRYFKGKVEKKDISIYIDCSNIGSSNGIYSNSNLPVNERATGLIVDILMNIHAEFLKAFSADSELYDISAIAPILDDFTNAISGVEIDGEVSVERTANMTDKRTQSDKISLNISKNPNSTIDYGNEIHFERQHGNKHASSGRLKRVINFQLISKITRFLTEFLPDKKRIWILVDEWSTVDFSIQPYLADMLRRSFFTNERISFKIAAIEQRSFFRKEDRESAYIGIELGSDAKIAMNLDDYLVYDVNKERSKRFFDNLIRNHIKLVASEMEIDLTKVDSNLINWIQISFTQHNVFEELVKAGEGVPRDTMHILALAAQRNPDSQIPASVLKYAALQFFQTEKMQMLPEDSKIMLDWIRSEVIGTRNTRAFLLSANIDDKIIDKLFDLRVLHILNRSKSAAHKPGERYVVYKIDYGCYVDLIGTKNYPKGELLPDDEVNEDIFTYDVPEDDARSYRRSILDLNKFYVDHQDLI